MPVEDWERIESEEMGDYDVFTVRRHTARSPRTGAVHQFHVLDVPSCVVAIPFTGDGRVVLVEQFRHAVQRVSLEFPAGVMEDGETAVAAALRELEEETGYCAKTAELVAEFDPDPAIQSNAIKVVLARSCAEGGKRNLDSGEDVQVRLAGVEEVQRLIEEGVIRSAPAITAWTLLRLRATEDPSAPID
jgi:ADP-ribose pyrophosphatase